MKQKNYRDLAEWVVETARKNGADQSAAAITNRKDVEIEFRDGKLDKLKESTQNSLNLDIYTDHRYSSHTTSDLKQVSLEKFIEQAVAGTKYLTEDKYRSLPDPKHYNVDVNKDLRILDNKYSEIEPSQRVKIAGEIEKIASEQSDKIISTTAGYSDVSYRNIRVHSNGLIGEESGTYFTAGASVTVDDESGGRPADWYWATTRYLSDLPKPGILAKEAAKRAANKIGQKKIKSGKYDTVVENRGGWRLLSTLYRAMRARNLQQKNSFLEGLTNKKIASEKLTVIDDPFLEKGLGSQWFDSEGLAAKRRIMIEKGILKHLYIDNYYGRKLDMELTSKSASNVVFEYGRRGMNELISEIQKGILITGFIGGNSNSTTGDFSLGIVGFYVENGKIIHPVNEMNISGNAREFWHQLTEIGNDPYVYSSRRVPSMRFEAVQFSGI